MIPGQHVAPTEFDQRVVADRLIAVADPTDRRQRDDGRGQQRQDPPAPPSSRQAVTVRGSRSRRRSRRRLHAVTPGGPMNTAVSCPRNSIRIDARPATRPTGAGRGTSRTGRCRRAAPDRRARRPRDRRSAPRAVRRTPHVLGRPRVVGGDLDHPVVGAPRVDEPTRRPDDLGGGLLERDHPVLGDRHPPRFVHADVEPGAFEFAHEPVGLAAEEVRVVVPARRSDRPARRRCRPLASSASIVGCSSSPIVSPRRSSGWSVAGAMTTIDTTTTRPSDEARRPGRSATCRWRFGAVDACGARRPRSRRSPRSSAWSCPTPTA